MHTNPLIEAHHALLEADATYANLPSPANHLAVLRAQRYYYVLLRQHYRHTHTPAPTPALCAEVWVRRAQILLERARLNTQRRKDSPRWQEIALHQYRRARRTLNRARAQADLWTATTPAPTNRSKPPRTTRRRVRVPHPITRRWIYVTVED